MSDNKQEPKNLLVRTDDGFANNDDGSDRLLHGRRIVFIDGEWTLDEVAIPPGKHFLATGTAEGIQHWQDGQLVEEMIKKPGVSLPDVDELNATIPQSEWDEGRNGLRPPYAYVWAVYLLDEKDGADYTHLNSTDGAAIGTRDLRSRVKWKRAMSGGRMLLPTVTLGRQIVSRKYRKWGPRFDVVPEEWRDLGPDPLSQTTAPQELEDHTEKAPLNDPVAAIGRPVAEPTMEEILDKIPDSGAASFPGSSLRCHASFLFSRTRRGSATGVGQSRAKNRSGRRA